MNKNTLIALGAVVAIAGAGFWWDNGDGDAAQAASSTTSSGDTIIIPTFSQAAQSGEIAYNENCAACHGINAAGTDNGPTFIHRVYEPSHHGDGAFFIAALNGVRAHHWRFGDMPPVEGITETKLRWIVKYVRELQEANGI